MLGLVLTFIGCSAKSAGSDCTETCWVYVTSVIDAKTFNTSHGLMHNLNTRKGDKPKLSV